MENNNGGQEEMSKKTRMSKANMVKDMSSCTCKVVAKHFSSAKTKDMEPYIIITVE